MIKSKRIFIVGHMGAGKALRGEALAEKLGFAACKELRQKQAPPILEKNKRFT